MSKKTTIITALVIFIVSGVLISYSLNVPSPQKGDLAKSSLSSAPSMPSILYATQDKNTTNPIETSRVDTEVSILPVNLQQSDEALQDAIDIRREALKATTDTNERQQLRIEIRQLRQEKKLRAHAKSLLEQNRTRAAMALKFMQDTNLSRGKLTQKMEQWHASKAVQTE